MPEITNPRQLVLQELGDILYVEQKLADEVLPTLIGEVTDTEFRDGLEGHLQETRGPETEAVSGCLVRGIPRP